MGWSRLSPAAAMALLWLCMTALGAGAQGALPDEPLRVTLAGKGREPGRPGGELRTILPRDKDIRLLSAWGYARLIGYDERLDLVPDIAARIEVEEGRIFTIHLRAGHRWSDGAPFTAEDFRYFWEDVANDPLLSPAGPPDLMLVAGKPPRFEVINETTIRYTWDAPNPGFLPALAQAREPYIYRPAHYLKAFHARYGDNAFIEEQVAAEKVSGWAALHNRRDSMFANDNPDLPTLQPWVVRNPMPAQRFTFERNPYFHRVDEKGQQLPYIDRILVDIADPSLIPAKTVAGETDLQARGLSLRDVTALKSGEASANYLTRLWPIAKGSQVALYPNLNANDPVWRSLMRDRRFRLALSLGIDRADINATLFFGLGTQGNNTAVMGSPLFDADRVSRNATFDPGKANALLDEMGLAARDASGFRLLPDGRTMELLIETAGESEEESDVLALIAQSWAGLGLKAILKPSERSVLRNRVYAGEAVMSAWSGFDNGMPAPGMPPLELAPLKQETFCWPKWGQYAATRGKSGEPVDLAPAQQLLDLFAEWEKAPDEAARARVWTRMLDLHADELFTIGTVMGVSQPVAVSKALRNVPEKAWYGWDPGAQFGIYRMDEFWLDRN